MYIVERTNKAELRAEEQSEKAECRKDHKDRNRHTNKIKRSGQARLVYAKNINHSNPTT